jgi:hypothetical protein
MSFRPGSPGTNPWGAKVNHDETYSRALQMVKIDEAVTTKSVWDICKRSVKVHPMAAD